MGFTEHLMNYGSAAEIALFQAETIKRLSEISCVQKDNLISITSEDIKFKPALASSFGELCPSLKVRTEQICHPLIFKFLYNVSPDDGRRLDAILKKQKATIAQTDDGIVRLEVVDEENAGGCMRNDKLIKRNKLIQQDLSSFLSNYSVVTLRVYHIHTFDREWLELIPQLEQLSYTSQRDGYSRPSKAKVCVNASTNCVCVYGHIRAVLKLKAEIKGKIDKVPGHNCIETLSK